MSPGWWRWSGRPLGHMLSHPLPFWRPLSVALTPPVIPSPLAGRSLSRSDSDACSGVLSQDLCPVTISKSTRMRRSYPLSRVWDIKSRREYVHLLLGACLIFIFSSCVPLLQFITSFVCLWTVHRATLTCVLQREATNEVSGWREVMKSGRPLANVFFYSLCYKM